MISCGQCALTVLNPIPILQESFHRWYQSKIDTKPLIFAGFIGSFTHSIT